MTVDTDRPRLSVLVIAWNSAAALPGLLESIGEMPDIEVVLVDNASSDDTLDVARRWPGRLRTITNSSNLGFAAALRQAAEAATGDVIVHLNPDIRLEPGTLDAMLGCLGSGPRIGAVGPKLIDSDGEVDRFCARRLPTLRAALVQSLGLNEVLGGTRLDPYTYPAFRYDDERDVPCLSGSAFLLRREALESSGGIDDRWFMYFEDIDLCARLGAHGWRLRYCPAAVARHAGAASSPRSPSLRLWLAVHLEAAVNLFFAVHRGRAQATVHRALTGLAGVGRIVASAPLRMRSGEDARRSFRLGVALLRWAATSRLPAGAPPGIA